MSTPLSIPITVVATVPSTLSSKGKSLRSFPINLFLDAPNKIDPISFNSFNLDRTSIFCSTFFPKPKPGSKIIVSLSIPYLSAILNVFSKNSLKTNK